jgi:hypothetical protein
MNYDLGSPPNIDTSGQFLPARGSNKPLRVHLICKFAPYTIWINVEMPIFGSLINRALRIRKQFTFPHGTAKTYQVQVLKRLMMKAMFTEFGRRYQFAAKLGK